jgi:hypothetical protein
MGRISGSPAPPASKPAWWNLRAATASEASRRLLFPGFLHVVPG